MTYSQILKEVYFENKKFIRAYVIICLVFSIFAFGNESFVFAGSGFTSTEAVGTLGGSFGKAAAPLLTQASLVGIDTPSAFLILSGISLALDLIPESSLAGFGSAIGVEGLAGLSGYSFGLIEIHLVKVFFLVWFLFDKLSKSNRLSGTFGVILEKCTFKMGALVNAAIASSQLLANIVPETSVQAAVTTSQTIDTVRYSLNALICFVLLMAVLVTYLFIRCLFLFINIVLLPVASMIPFFSFGVESIKFWSVVGLVCTAVSNPVTFGVIYAVILIIAILLFKRAYIAIRYFGKIYVKPFFKSFRGYDSEIPLVMPKLPKKVRRYVNESDINIIIPVYILKKVNGLKYTRRYDRWWFVSEKERQYICKPCFMKDTCYCIVLNNSIDKKMFIKKSLRFFEVFNLKGTEENIGRAFRKVHKNIYFVFSKEYYYRFSEIKDLTMYTDYMEYKKQIQKNVKLSREEKRIAKLEAKEEKRIARKKRILA